MKEELERSIRAKIADLQICLGTKALSVAKLEAIDVHLGKALEVIEEPESRSAECEAS